MNAFTNAVLMNLMCSASSKKGRREEQKDEWNERLKEWNYAYRGKTVDGTELRVAVALKPNGVLVVTVINLG